MKRILPMLILLAFTGCALHVHLGGTYYRDKPDQPPPVELVFPADKEKSNEHSQ